MPNQLPPNQAPRRPHYLYKVVSHDTIYGLKQATLAWWKALDKSMGELGFTHLHSDSGIFVNKDQSIVIIVYIDNILFLGTDKKKLLKTKVDVLLAPQ
jgi:hypothetical protein